MAKRDLAKLYYRIGEVSRIVGVQPHVLRYWETEFRTIRPQKSSRGQRVYSRKDVEKLIRVKELLRHEGFTIAGARKMLRESQSLPAPMDGAAGVPAASAPIAGIAPAHQPTVSDSAVPSMRVADGAADTAISPASLAAARTRSDAAPTARAGRLDLADLAGGALRPAAVPGSGSAPSGEFHSDTSGSQSGDAVSFALGTSAGEKATRAAKRMRRGLTNVRADIVRMLGELGDPVAELD